MLRHVHSDQGPTYSAFLQRRISVYEQTSVTARRRVASTPHGTLPSKQNKTSQTVLCVILLKSFSYNRLGPNEEQEALKQDFPPLPDGQALRSMLDMHIN